MKSPTQQTIKLMKSLGYRCAVTERWNPFAKIRQDLFGFIDVLAIHPEKKRIIGIQTTTFGHRVERVNKILNMEKGESKEWVKAGGEILVLSWKEKTKNGRVIKYLPDFVYFNYDKVSDRLIVFVPNDSVEGELYDTPDTEEGNPDTSGN